MSPERGFSIAVDARALQSSGIGRYLREIIARLLRSPAFDGVTLLGDVEDLRGFIRTVGPDDGKVSLVAHGGGLYTPRSQAFWVRRSTRVSEEVDVTFFPHYDAPYFGFPSRSVVTIHDLTHFKLPELFPPWKRAAAGRLLDRVVGRATRILVDSDATRKDLIERLPGESAKVETIELGVGKPFIGTARGSRNGLAEPYVLCVGNRPHKNLTRAIEAFATVRADHRQLRMVIVGSHVPGAEMVRARATELGVMAVIEEIPTPTDAELRELYAGCRVFLFPSLYEGFGLPVLEAMACGAPVICSTSSSLPAVVGDAGVLVDPLEPREMAAALKRLLENPHVANELSRRGRERAATFTWERTAERTIRVLSEVASTGRRARPQRMART